MPPVDINYLAVILAAVSSMVIGSFWYSKMAFGAEWIRLTGLSEKKLEESKRKGMTKVYGIMFIGSLVMAYVLAHFVNYAGATTLSQGMQAGFWTWLGFVATVSLASVLFEDKPFKLYIINNGYQLVTLLVMGAILASF